MRRVEFHNSKLLEKLCDHLEKNRFGDWNTQSINLYQHFLKMINTSDYKQLQGIKIDKYEMHSGCIIFYDDEHINLVIVSFDDTDVNELTKRIGI
ncbi:hypothetical protein [Methanosarcina barkeri]|uniref:Uncharacterized protein n=1 Tax=Methanosarcina barkeri CM1 TaxID=796385 RepID=A0A0G3CDA1_METBA|nr:hypothetical protein [Methanosarcina barkeri]AKJ39994.1 hypothetical protein MCM1_3002 [Methanosarcina barkeri CM1]